MGFLDDIIASAKSVVGKAEEQTDKVVELSKLKYQSAQLSSELRSLYEKLGRAVYAMMNEEQGNQETFAGLDASTFRDRYVVSMEDSSLTMQTVEHIRQIEGVADVSVHYEITNGFQTVQRVLNVASIAIIAVLFVVSLFIISNTVKLSMYGRKEEIGIMKMVGATNSFIRLPFVVEGFILGMLGAAIAFFLEWGLYTFVGDKIAAIDTLQLVTVVPFTEVIEIVAIAYAITGFFVGVFGSVLSIRKFLKV